LEKCLFLGNGRGFARLLNDQSAKLNGLLNDLVRFEATGTNAECKSIALDWWADFMEPLVDTDEAEAPFAETKATPELASQTQDDGFAGDNQDREGLLFANQKLTRKVHNLIDRLNEVESRAASLQYRVATLNEDNKRLEMGYTGASTQARGLEKLVRELTTEIKTLKEGNAGQRSKAAP
jgi:hypothetical protein